MEQQRNDPYILLPKGHPYYVEGKMLTIGDMNNQIRPGVFEVRTPVPETKDPVDWLLVIQIIALAFACFCLGFALGIR
jgi:hypothetical protein